MKDKVIIYIVDPYRSAEDQELEILNMLYGKEAAEAIMRLMKKVKTEVEEAEE